MGSKQICGVILECGFARHGVAITANRRRAHIIEGNAYHGASGWPVLSLHRVVRVFDRADIEVEKLRLAELVRSWEARGWTLITREGF